MKVEDLSQFGKPLDMPKRAQRKMLGIVFSTLRECWRDEPKPKVD